VNIRYEDAPALFPGTRTWLPGTLDAVDGGDYVVHKPNGTLLSVQSDGSYQERPHDAVGAWERCQKDPDLDVLHYRGTGVPYAIVYEGA
jgi:hypothetical protein